MNKFLKHRSKLAVFFTYVCIIALFADGANLTDLFTYATTIHFDEVDDSQTAASVSLSNYRWTPPEYPSPGLASKYAAQKVTLPKWVILDQDSPSLAASSLSSAPEILHFAQSEKTPYRTVVLGESLYLQYCSLLL